MTILRRIGLIPRFVFTMFALLLFAGEAIAAVPPIPPPAPAAGLPSLYLGPVATRGGVNRQVIGTVGRYSNVGTVHIATDDIVALRVLDGAFYTPSAGAETPSGGDITTRLGIEYPIGGTVVQGLYSGSAAGTITNGSLLLSDWVSVSIPKGASFRVRRNLGSSVALPYMSEWVAVTGDGYEGSATPLTDKSLSGTITAAALGSAVPMQPPIVVLGMTRKGTVAIMGDSKARGAPDLGGPSQDVGEIARSLGGAGIGYINLSISGDTAQGYVASHTLRQQIAAYASGRIVEYLINDKAAGRTAAQMAADAASIVGYQNGAPTWLTTITPQTTSTDGWATLANQTVTGSEPARLTYNSGLRAGTWSGVGSVIKGVIDLDKVVADPAGTGKWVVGYTLDGLHETTTALILYQSLGTIPIAAFGR